jgi:uncharacterized protein (DUF433 family)
VADLRDVPTYEIAEAAHYLHLPKSTLRNWTSGHAHFKRVIDVPDPKRPSLLSFVNLVEAHMLATIRRKHDISLQKIRPAIDYLRRHYDEPHPLATMDLEADEVDLFVREAGKVLNISKQGQVAMKEAVEAHLRRVERGRGGVPLVLYPFVSADYAIERKPVMFNPDVSFGRLVIANTGIPTSEVAERFFAGETIAELAHDFRLPPSDIEDAIRFEYPLEAAA